MGPELLAALREEPRTSTPFGAIPRLSSIRQPSADIVRESCGAEAALERRSAL